MFWNRASPPSIRPKALPTLTAEVCISMLGLIQHMEPRSVIMDSPLFNWQMTAGSGSPTILYCIFFILSFPGPSRDVPSLTAARRFLSGPAQHLRGKNCRVPAQVLIRRRAGDGWGFRLPDSVPQRKGKGKKNLCFMARGKPHPPRSWNSGSNGPQSSGAPGWKTACISR